MCGGGGSVKKDGMSKKKMFGVDELNESQTSANSQCKWPLVRLFCGQIRRKLFLFNCSKQTLVNRSERIWGATEFQK